MSTLLTVVDLENFQFAENPGDRSVWLQAMPMGTYSHPIYGDLTFDSSRIDNFVRNFNDNVREAALDIDYDHKDKETRAAGWITAAENRGLGAQGGLWIQVEFTPSAYQALSDKEYRYFSPEFADQWTNPKTNTEYKDVLFGGAITNRPFLRDIQPINLSELSSADKQGDGMEEFLKQLAELLGHQGDELKLDDPKTGETLLSEIKALKDTPKPKEPDPKPDIQKLAESNEDIARVLAENAEIRKQLAIVTAANRLSEVTARLKETSNDKWMLPPAFTDSVRTVLVRLNEKDANEILEAVGELAKTGLVPMTTPGGAQKVHESAAFDDPSKAFNEKVSAYAKDNNVDYATAASALAKTEPELFALYEGQVLASMRMEEG